MIACIHATSVLHPAHVLFSEITMIKDRCNRDNKNVFLLFEICICTAYNYRKPVSNMKMLQMYKGKILSVHLHNIRAHSIF